LYIDPDGPVISKTANPAVDLFKVAHVEPSTYGGDLTAFDADQIVIVQNFEFLRSDVVLAV